MPQPSFCIHYSMHPIHADCASAYVFVRLLIVSIYTHLDGLCQGLFSVDSLGSCLKQTGQINCVPIGFLLGIMRDYGLVFKDYSVTQTNYCLAFCQLGSNGQGLTGAGKQRNGEEKKCPMNVSKAITVAVCLTPNWVSIPLRLCCIYFPLIAHTLQCFIEILVHRTILRNKM